MSREKTACLTGPRPKNLPWGYDEKHKDCVAFKKLLKLELEQVIKNGISNFLVGMALGYDMIACEILIKLRKKYKTIKIQAIVPCRNQEIKWTKTHQKRYKNLLKKCDDVTVLQEEYSTTCMNDRNKYMVDNSSLVIAYKTDKPGGTLNTIKYATKIGLKIKFVTLQKKAF